MKLSGLELAVTGCAFVVLAASALAAGTIPAVGGYSNISGTSFGVHKNRNDFTTVGIVIQIEGNAFGVQGESSAAESLVAGKGILSKDKIWVEADSIVHILDTSGSYVTVSGPAAVEFSKNPKIQNQNLVKIYKGSVRLRASDGQTIYFENGYASGAVSGEAAVWASGELTQVLSLSGKVKVWHPRLSQSPVAVSPGFFTEASASYKSLQPKKPLRADEERFYTFLAHFERQRQTTYPQDADDEEEGSREIASVGVGSKRGSRTVADVVEEKNPAALEILKKHVAGIDYEQPADLPLRSMKKTKSVQRSTR